MKNLLKIYKEEKKKTACNALCLFQHPLVAAQQIHELNTIMENTSPDHSDMQNMHDGSQPISVISL